MSVKNKKKYFNIFLNKNHLKKISCIMIITGKKNKKGRGRSKINGETEVT
jgi:hypothetical protein